ncbi:hypothetical protein M0R45_002678 [Rubus argutus]|uniref:G domain-containing protein n=1 Tax=Rubus argutus TaxID=59490 RepID=A0AAW1VSH4_RUBAR
MPVVDLETPTLCLVGAPNVGKSSLVRILSTEKPEVCNYPFTTRGILMGHIILNHQTFQVTDTPGLLKSCDGILEGQIPRSQIQREGFPSGTKQYSGNERQVFCRWFWSPPGPDQTATESLLATDQEVLPWVQKISTQPRNRLRVLIVGWKLILSQVDLISTLSKLSSLGQQVNY